MNDKKRLYIIATLAFVVIAGFIIWGLKQPNGESQSDIIYYYGNDCPHCQNVTKFLDDNKIAEKVKFEKKEVGSNPKNALEMGKKAKECKIDPKNIGVPFVWARGKCLVGEPDVENFFKQEAGIN
jgi:glutaredoxin